MYKIYLNIHCKLNVVKIQFESSSSFNYILSRIVDIASKFDNEDVKRFRGSIVNVSSNEAFNYNVDLSRGTIIFDIP